MWPAGYEDPLKLCLSRCLVGGQALKVNNGGQAKLKSIRISPDLRYILWEPSKKGTNAKFGASPLPLTSPNLACPWSFWGLIKRAHTLSRHLSPPSLDFFFPPPLLSFSLFLFRLALSLSRTSFSILIALFQPFPFLSIFYVSPFYFPTFFLLPLCLSFFFPSHLISGPGPCGVCVRWSLWAAPGA